MLFSNFFTIVTKRKRPCVAITGNISNYNEFKNNKIEKEIYFCNCESRKILEEKIFSFSFHLILDYQVVILLKMLITEFRIILPMNVEEYQIAQLYSTAKISKQNTGGGEGVEVLVNEPFERPMSEAFLGKYNSGQYTKKIYHFATRVPGWVRLLFSDSSLSVHEEAWNAYPYCRTILKNSYMKENMIIDISTLHLSDRGESENVHQLTADELDKRNVVYINIADKVNRNDYKPEEDPQQFKSTKTGRGPLLSTEPWYKICEPYM